MVYKLAAKSNLFMAYAGNLKKVVAFAELQALQEKLDEVVKSNKELTLRLAEVERMVEDDKSKAKTLLAEACTSVRQLQRSNDDLKLDIQRSTEKSKELVTERDNLLTERDSLRGKMQKMEEENKFLGDEVINEHVLGFNKPIARCNLLYQVPLDDPHFDVTKIIVNGELVPISTIPKTPTLIVQTVKPHPIVEVIEETDGANAQLEQLNFCFLYQGLVIFP